METKYDEELESKAAISSVLADEMKNLQFEIMRSRCTDRSLLNSSSQQLFDIGKKKSPGVKKNHPFGESTFPKDGQWHVASNQNTATTQNTLQKLMHSSDLQKMILQKEHEIALRRQLLTQKKPIERSSMQKPEKKLKIPMKLLNLPPIRMSTLTEDSDTCENKLKSPDKRSPRTNISQTGFTVNSASKEHNSVLESVKNGSLTLKKNSLCEQESRIRRTYQLLRHKTINNLMSSKQHGTKQNTYDKGNKVNEKGENIDLTLLLKNDNITKDECILSKVGVGNSGLSSQSRHESEGSLTTSACNIVASSHKSSETACSTQGSTQSKLGSKLNIDNILDSRSQPKMSAHDVQKKNNVIVDYERRQNSMNTAMKDDMKGAEIVMMFSKKSGGKSHQDPTRKSKGIQEGQEYVDSVLDDPRQNQVSLIANRFNGPEHEPNRKRQRTFKATTKLNLDDLDALPQLPLEPEYDSSQDEIKMADMARANRNEKYDAQATLKKNSGTSTKVDRPVIIPIPLTLDTSAESRTIAVDTWWPSNGTIKRERRMRGYKSEDDDSSDNDDCKHSGASIKKPSALARERRENPLEPGVLEKLPHCKVHRVRSALNGVSASEPLFCFQVTELYPTDVMLCCSICHTWRHACCGGHHNFTGHLPKSSAAFSVVCDLCYKERENISGNRKTKILINRQRQKHLRRTMAVNQVVRQVSFSKHGGTYKWPLGSVSATHIGGHTRSVNGRHERSEKQWGEMAMKLGNGLGYRPKERLKVRTRELERLLLNVEDAELFTDRHNMMVFLQRDTNKKRPAGYEVAQRNIFDPADDVLQPNDASEDVMNKIAPTDETTSEDEDSGNHGNNSDDSESTKNSQSDVAKNGNKEQNGIRKENIYSLDVASDSSDCQTESVSSTKSPDHSTSWSEGQVAPLRRCARLNCAMKPRFDSIFCSDACGVSALESDLLQTLEYANVIHPSFLR